MTKPASNRPSRIQIEVRDIPQGVRQTVKSQHSADADGGDINHE